MNERGNGPRTAPSDEQGCKRRDLSRQTRRRENSRGRRQDIAKRPAERQPMLQPKSLNDVRFEFVGDFVQLGQYSSIQNTFFWDHGDVETCTFDAFNEVGFRSNSSKSRNPDLNTG